MPDVYVVYILDPQFLSLVTSFIMVMETLINKIYIHCLCYDSYFKFICLQTASGERCRLGF